MENNTYKSQNNQLSPDFIQQVQAQNDIFSIQTYNQEQCLAETHLRNAVIIRIPFQKKEKRLINNSWRQVIVPKLLLGSGTIISINGQNYIVTVAHNLVYKKQQQGGTQRELNKYNYHGIKGFVFDQSRYWEGRKQISLSQKFANATYLEISSKSIQYKDKIKQQRENDLGFIKITNQVPQNQGLQIQLNFNQFDKYPVYLMGFPYFKCLKFKRDHKATEQILNETIDMKNLSDSHLLKLTYRRLNIRQPKKQNSNLIRYYSSAWQGQSGGGIVVQKNGKWKIIGVHIGGDSDIKVNFGLLFTTKIIKNFPNIYRGIQLSNNKSSDSQNQYNQPINPVRENRNSYSQRMEIQYENNSFNDRKDMQQRFQYFVIQNGGLYDSQTAEYVKVQRNKLIKFQDQQRIPFCNAVIIRPEIPQKMNKKTMSQLALGSGILININRVPYVVTAAHIMLYNKRQLRNVKCFMMKQDNQSQLKNLRAQVALKQKYFLNKYAENMDSIQRLKYELFLINVQKHAKGVINQEQGMQIHYNWSIQEGDQVYLMGVPYINNSRQISMNTFHNSSMLSIFYRKVEVVRTRQNEIYYRNQTYQGQSGGGLVIYRYGIYKLIGIHVAYSKKSKEGFGNLFTIQICRKFPMIFTFLKRDRNIYNDQDSYLQNQPKKMSVREKQTGQKQFDKGSRNQKRQNEQKPENDFNNFMQNRRQNKFNHQW